MVFCGKPSKGCDRCRKKRIKCDQVVPTCKQCKNAGIECSGYREEIDLIFRNQNEAVARKYQNKSKPGHSRQFCQTTRDLPLSTPSKAKSIGKSKEYSSGSPVLSFPKICVEDIAVNFLLSTYLKGSHYEYLPNLYISSTANGVLLPTTQAAALASLSHDSQRPDIMVLARQRYAQGLKLTNAALKDAQQVYDDETLASVMLLALFETFSHKDMDSTTWGQHANGALAILSLRGIKQFKSSVGLEIFKHTSSIIRVKCVQEKRRVPPELISLSTQATKYLDNNHPVLKFSAIVASFTELRASIEEQSLTDPNEIITWAQEVDEQTLNLALEMPSSWQYDVAYTSSNSEHILRNRYHIYKDHHIAQLWNTIRMTRLLLNQIVYDHVPAALTSATPENISYLAMVWDRSSKVIMDMAEEICASVPQFLPNYSQSKQSESVSVAPGYFLMWPLFIAGGTTVPPPEVREYIIGRLRYIGNRMKIPQALNIAAKLESSVRLDCWDSIHVFHLF